MSKRYQIRRVGDIDIHYELADYTPPWRTTPAETLLLYHGYARNMLFWQPWVPLLAADYRVLRFDARGCGETTQPPAGSRMSFAQLAGDAIGLMNALGIARVHWVGESSGGIVGMTAALAHPGRIATLTLCDTPFKRAAKIATTYNIMSVGGSAWVRAFPGQVMDVFGYALYPAMWRRHPEAARAASSR